jgi:hypothetical protein
MVLTATSAKPTINHTDLSLRTLPNALKFSNGSMPRRLHSPCMPLLFSMRDGTSKMHLKVPWLETELSLSQGQFLCGENVTAADIMMQFSAEFIIARELGTNGKEWPNINKWLEACKNTEGYKRAVEKTGHQL